MLGHVCKHQGEVTERDALPVFNYPQSLRETPTRLAPREHIRELTHFLLSDKNSSDSRASSVVNSGSNMVIVESAAV